MLIYKKIEKNLKFSINCSLFQDFFDDDTEINDLINNYNDECYDYDLKLSIKSKNGLLIFFIKLFIII